MACGTSKKKAAGKAQAKPRCGCGSNLCAERQEQREPLVDDGTRSDTREIRRMLTRVASDALRLRREAKAAVADMDSYRRESVARLIEGVQDALDDVEAML